MKLITLALVLALVCLPLATQAQDCPEIYYTPEITLLGAPCQVRIDTLDYYDPDVVKGFIHQHWPKHSDNIIDLVYKESSFDPFADNPTSSATGFTQIIKKTAKHLKVDHKLLEECPWFNLIMGINYYMDECVPKARGNPKLALFFYQNGPNYTMKN